MNIRPAILFALVAACNPPSMDIEPEDDSGTEEAPPVCSQSEPDDRFASEPIVDAQFDCTNDGCTLALPDSIPARQWDPLAMNGQTIVVPGLESGQFVMANPDGVFLVTIGTFVALHVGDDGNVWFELDETLVALAPDGQVSMRCDIPSEVATVRAVSQVADTIWVAGVNAENRGELWTTNGDDWQERPTTVSIEGFVPYQQREIFALAYGYFELHDPQVDGGIQLGGSDDDFSAVAICPDQSYWAGGMTGLYMYCTADHVCERTTEGDYPFQSTSYGCNEDNQLWWFDPGFEVDSPVTIGTVTRQGERGVEPLPEGIRHRRSQAGRTWEVVNRE